MERIVFYSYVFWYTVARAKRFLFFLCESFISKDWVFVSFRVVFVYVTSHKTSQLKFFVFPDSPFPPQLCLNYPVLVFFPCLWVCSANQ